MAKRPIYGIKTFPRDEHLWRVVLFGGIFRNPRIPSEPVIEVLLSRVPDDMTDPLSPAALTSNQKFKTEIGVGMLPYVSISSCWRNHRPVPVNTENYQRILALDTAKVRILTIGELYLKHKIMPPSASLVMLVDGPGRSGPWPWSIRAPGTASRSCPLGPLGFAP